MKRIAVILTILFIMTAAGCSGGGSEKSEKTAAELLDTVLNSVEFPPTVLLTDEERIGDMGIDIAYAEEYAIAQQMLSVDVVEVIVIKAKEGKVSELVTALEKRRDSLINDFAFYPEQLESAEATVVGSCKDVCYLICHTDADEAEKQLREAI